MITAICQECDKQFDYDLKPGFPRKYCFECSEAKKAAFADKQPLEVPVVKVGQPADNQTFKKAPVVNGQLAMYVSYAKDIFCALLGEDKTKEPEIVKEYMKLSTDLVKQAQKELA